jgi:hypothetical protein
MPEVSRVLQRSLSDEIVYGRSERLRVFVSSQMRGQVLDAERRGAIEAIDSHPDFRAWAWERDSAAGPYSSQKVCVRHAKTSDALVLLVGDNLTKVTAMEYRAARRAAVPSFVFLKEGSSRPEDVEKFIAREQKRGVTTNFANVAEMKTQILHALQTYTRTVYRRSIADARMKRS